MAVKKRKGGGRFPVERDLIRSPAYLELSGKAPQALMVFLSKARMARLPARHGRKEWQQINNGDIRFTYAEAKEVGISKRTFTRARDQLVKHGFVDIAHAGGGMMQDATLYGLSERWRLYGTPEFQHTVRKRDARRIGYQGKNRKRRANGRFQRSQTPVEQGAQTPVGESGQGAQTPVGESA